MFKKEEKNKVGRPKLADSETKKKSIITLSIALVFAIALVIGGTFSLFRSNNLMNLQGKTCIADKYSRKIAWEWRTKCPNNTQSNSNGKCIKKVNKTEIHQVGIFYKGNICEKGEATYINKTSKYKRYKCTWDEYQEVNKVQYKYFYYPACKSGYKSGANGICVKYKECGTKSGSRNTKPNTTTRYSSGGNNYVATTTRTTTTTTTKKLGKCEITVKGGKTLSYNISCKDGAKFKKGQANISNEITKIKSLKGTVTPELSNLKRNGYITIIYNNGSKDVKLNSKLVTINNISDYQKQCLNSDIKDAKESCKKYRYHIINTSTFCRAYAYNESSNTHLAIRCDSNAAPFKTELYEYDSSEKEYKLVFRDTNWLRNYGFWANKAYDNAISKYVKSKKIQKGKKYVFRIVYRYNDRTNGIITDNSKNLVTKIDQASSGEFVYGDTKLKGLDEQIKTRSQNDKYGTTEFKKQMTSDDKCKVIASSKGKTIKYNIECGKNAYPGSLRIVTKYDKGKNGSAYAGNLTVTHNSTYLNNTNAKESTIPDNGGVIRTLFENEAKENNTNSYGMKEDGVISGLESGKNYSLVLYYGYKNSVTKARAQIKVASSAVTIK